MPCADWLTVGGKRRPLAVCSRSGAESPRMDLEMLEPEMELVTPELLEVVPDLEQLVGRSGARPEVEKELREAEARWGACRRAWLRWECLQRALRELSLSQEPQGPLLPALEQLLGQKVAALELYYRGEEEEEEKKEEEEEEEEEEETPGSQSGPGPRGGVAAALARDRLRLRRAQRQQGELRRELERLQETYLRVLSHSRSQLVELLGMAEQRAELDEGHALYLEAKMEAVLEKIRMEEVNLLLDTYPKPTLEAHERIRSALQEGRDQVRAEAELVQESLSAYEALGPRFTLLAEEYRSLRQRLEERRWALRQLRPLPGPAPPPAEPQPGPAPGSQ